MFGVTLLYALVFLHTLFKFALFAQNESDEDIQTIPTIGFNVETLAYKNIKFQVRAKCPFYECFSVGSVLIYPRDDERQQEWE